MNRRMRWLISVILLVLLPVSALAAPTASSVYASMIALKDEYYEGRPWTNDDFYAWKGGIFSGGYGCAGFAFILSDAAFGSLPARQISDVHFDDVRVGDILRINGNTHSVVVLQKYSDHVTLAEGNYNASIHWGRSYSKASVEAADYYLTRYPAAAVKITAQPQSVVVSAAGVTAKTTVTATGDGLTYQWYVKDLGSSAFSKSSNTTKTYSVALTAAKSGRQVYCVVGDKYGNTVQSNTVTLSIAEAVKITTQPKSVTVAKAGDTARTTVTATGDGLTYQWYVKDPGSSSFTKSSNTTKTYSVALTAAKSGRQVYCVVEDKYGNTVKSNTATLTVAAGVKITTQPKSVTVAKAGDTARTTVTATGDGLTYQWYVKDLGSSSFTKSSNTTKTYSVALTAAKSGRQVYCVVEDKYGNTVKSNTATLTVAAGVKITTQPKSVTVAKAGDTARTTVTATGDGLTYQWYVKDPGSSSFTKSSNTTKSYSVVLTAAKSGRQVYCVVGDKYGNTVKSNTATLSIAK